MSDGRREVIHRLIKIGSKDESGEGGWKWDEPIEALSGGG